MGAVRFHVEALKKHPMSCCMCEPTETAQSLGDEAHAAVKRPKSASEHGLHTKCGFRKYSPLIGVQTRTRANLNVRPRHLVYDKAKSRGRRRKQRKEEGDKEKQTKQKKSDKERKKGRE